VNVEDFVSVYYPWQFNGQMGLSELLTVSETESFAVESLEEVFQEDLSLVYLKGLDVGFRGDQILYIRAIPVGAGARDMPVTVEVTETVEATEPPEQPVSDSGLTLIEQAYKGTHTYQTTCMYSYGTSESEMEEIDWTFTEEGLYFDGDGPFPRIAENYYGLQDETGGFFFMFSMDTVVLSGSIIEADEEGNDITITYSCTLVQE